MEQNSSYQNILSIDIGGSHIKATVLNQQGELQMDYQKLVTPNPASPENVVKTIQKLIQNFPAFDCVSAGFPGYVKNGRILTAPNLDTSLWKNIDLQQMLSDALKKPAKVVNDADMQGLGVVHGKGFEIVVTLGTGFGTALLLNGTLLPHLEIAHHPISKNKTYDEYIGEAEMEEIGQKKWNKRMKKVIAVLKTVFNYDHLYIGGGNSNKLTFQLDGDISIVSNKDGIKGGAKLWQMNELPSNKTNLTAV